MRTHTYTYTYIHVTTISPNVQKFAYVVCFVAMFLVHVQIINVCTGKVFNSIWPNFEMNVHYEKEKETTTTKHNLRNNENEKKK